MDHQTNHFLLKNKKGLESSVFLKRGLVYYFFQRHVPHALGNNRSSMQREVLWRCGTNTGTVEMALTNIGIGFEFGCECRMEI